MLGLSVKKIAVKIALPKLALSYTLLKVLYVNKPNAEGSCEWSSRVMTAKLLDHFSIWREPAHSHKLYWSGVTLKPELLSRNHEKHDLGAFASNEIW